MNDTQEIDRDELERLAILHRIDADKTSAKIKEELEEKNVL